MLTTSQFTEASVRTLIVCLAVFIGTVDFSTIIFDYPLQTFAMFATTEKKALMSVSIPSCALGSERGADFLGGVFTEMKMTSASRIARSHSVVNSKLAWLRAFLK
jgi:hypothetical protein